MSFLGRGRKDDLKLLAYEMGLEETDNLKVIQLKELITGADCYNEEMIKNMLDTIIEQRIEKEKLAADEDKLAKEREFELERMKIQLESQNVSQPISIPEPEQPKWELNRILPKYDPKDDDMALFLNLFERQLKFLKVPEIAWIPYLIGSLPSEVGKLIAREPEEEYQEYRTVKEMLLKRYKLTADRYRQLFSLHRKDINNTWRDFYFDLTGYFEGWLSELKVKEFDQLKDLIISDQMKKRVSPEIKEHFMDEWTEWNSPLELADKLDVYESLRLNSRSNSDSSVRKKAVAMKEDIPKQCPLKKSYQNKTGKFKSNNQEKTPLSCYGCGNPGYIKAKCPNCALSKDIETVKFGKIRLNAVPYPRTDLAVLKISINGITGTACADSGASHSIASESLYRLLRSKGTVFDKTLFTITLADGSQTKKRVYTTCINLGLEGRSFPLTMVVLPEARGNQTLLGADFLKQSGVVLNLRNRTWFYDDDPSKCFHFYENAEVQTCDKEESIHTNPCILNTEKDTADEVNPYLLREDEGKCLTSQQRKQVNSLLKEYEECFRSGGETSPYTEHRINTGNSTPVAVPPYRMTPAKKEILKKELDDLLARGIIEECESPYASPVVLVPKPDGSMRLCIDYRKLNAVTVPDTYPLPRMDDLLHEAKHTSFMSTLDLRAGYHQIKVYPPDQDKTAFVCPFGTFRYLKMPFGLRNAPATFQRLIDQFRNGLKDVFALSYLDDIIVMSDSFEKHVSDLKTVFERLIEYKLNAKREKCHFVCDKVKYLGHWITPNGLEVDPAKVEAIVGIPPPKTVKQVQSFLQTCSWYRRFIPGFADISRPLSNLTKKKTVWKWGELEQKAFETLKKCLSTTPVLKQVDDTKPFILKTDASNYALGAVLLQGDDKTSEHPIEYASRLLTDAERNYSTTEREALAVVWALGKFRGYVEGQNITVATDHQPLKWLLSLKSPSGRLARWSLQIQSYNLNIDYVPGKSNVVADMLSRPVCSSELNSSEICNFVGVDMPTRSPSSIREAQLKDEALKKIIDCFEKNHNDENFVNWTERGYLMNQGILYRYAPDSETEEAQLVIPAEERQNILFIHHDSPTAGHYGEEGTYNRIAKRYFWIGMKSYISNYVKNCPECRRYKATNQKPAGLLRTPAYSQRFETLSIDLFGPLPESKEGYRWIFIVEDCATKWVELFPLISATATDCATTLIEEVFFRYGIPRKLISDNGSQFVSAVLQQVCYTLDIHQVLIPVYHPQANPVERKNRDLKPRLAILVGDAHNTWPDKLASIRFALNSAKSDTTGHTAAYLQFGRELRTIDDVVHDLKAVLDNDNFVPEITPYLKRLAETSKTIRERVEMKQDRQKYYYDKKRRQAYFSPGEKVWVNSHPLSSAAKKKTSKFMPKRDGPYLILTQRSPVTYEIASLDRPDQCIGTYHVSALNPFSGTSTTPVEPLRKRGRPRKQKS